MKYMYSVSDANELALYQNFANNNTDKIQEYLTYLADELDVVDMPEYMVLANLEMATKVFKEIDLPAYTNDVRMVYTPEIAVWRDLYLKQLDIYKDEKVMEKGKGHFQDMSDNHILQILGHELAHQSELFLDDFDNDDVSQSIWFEEGMVEYVSRKYFFTDVEFVEEKEFCEYLVRIYEEKFGHSTIEKFSYQTYDENITTIFYNYWRSFLAINKLVEKFGSVEKVFNSYHQWDKEGRKITLAKWFNLE